METSIQELERFNEAFQRVEVKQFELPPEFFDMDDNVQDFVEKYQTELDRIREEIQNLQKLSTIMVPKVKEALNSSEEFPALQSTASTSSIDSNASNTDEEGVKTKKKKKRKKKKGANTPKALLAKRWKRAVEEESFIPKVHSYRHRDFKKPNIHEKMKQLGFDFGDNKRSDDPEERELKKLGFLSHVRGENVQFESLHMNEVFERIHNLQQEMDEMEHSASNTDTSTNTP